MRAMALTGPIPSPPTPARTRRPRQKPTRVVGKITVDVTGLAERLHAMRAQLNEAMGVVAQNAVNAGTSIAQLGQALAHYGGPAVPFVEQGDELPVSVPRRFLEDAIHEVRQDWVEDMQRRLERAIMTGVEEDK